MIEVTTTFTLLAVLSGVAAPAFDGYIEDAKLVRAHHDVATRVGGHPANVIEVGYGGFRLEMPASLGAVSAVPILLDLPEYGVHAEARCVWVRPLGRSGLSWCGAAVSGEEAREGSRWRAAVDALPEALADPMRNL